MWPTPNSPAGWEATWHTGDAGQRCQGGWQDTGVQFPNLSFSGRELAADYISIFLAIPLKKELNNKIPHFLEIQQQEKTLCKTSTLLLNTEFNMVYLSSYTYTFRYTTFLNVDYKDESKVHLPWNVSLCITNDSSAIRGNHIKHSSKRKILKSQAVRYEKLLQINHPSTSVSLQMLS